MRVTLGHPLFLRDACFNIADGHLVMRVLQRRKVKIAPWRHTSTVRDIAVLKLYLGVRWGEGGGLGGYAMPRPLYFRERAPVAIVEEAGWALAPFWAGK